MLVAKMDLLIKKLESPHKGVNEIMESRITCETCGDIGYLGNTFPLTEEDVNLVVNNNPQQLRIPSSARMEFQAQPLLLPTTR